MSKTSGTIDLKSIKQAATGAVSYITDINDDNGIFVHEKVVQQLLQPHLMQMELRLPVM